MAAQLISIDTIRKHALASSNDALSLLNAQVGWASCAVQIDIALKDVFLQKFVEWRPDRDLRKHTRLKWLPDLLFFEEEADAMLFLLTFGDENLDADHD